MKASVLTKVSGSYIKELHLLCVIKFTIDLGGNLCNIKSRERGYMYACG